MVAAVCAVASVLAEGDGSAVVTPPVTAEGGVVDLSEETWDAFMKENAAVLVEFSAPVGAARGGAACAGGPRVCVCVWVVDGCCVRGVCVRARACGDSGVGPRGSGAGIARRSSRSWRRPPQ